MNMQLLMARARMNHLPSGTGDPHWANVVALLHFDGTNGSTSFADATGRAWAPSNVTVDNSVTLIAGGAGLFGGPSSPSSLGTTKAGLAMTGDFCIECTIRLSALPSTGRIMAILSTGNANSPYYGVRWFVDESGGIALYLSGNGTSITDIHSAAGVISAGTNYKVCVERQGTTVRCFVGGAVVASGSFSGAVWLSSGSSNATIGTAVDRSNVSAEQARLQGRTDEFRWTIGVARYGGAYTPSDDPFPDGP